MRNNFLSVILLLFLPLLTSCSNDEKRRELEAYIKKVEDSGLKNKSEVIQSNSNDYPKAGLHRFARHDGMRDPFVAPATKGSIKTSNKIWSIEWSKKH